MASRYVRTMRSTIVVRVIVLIQDQQSVCVRPHFVHQCWADLKGTNVKVASVIGFHEGSYDLLQKLQYVERRIHSYQD